MRQIIDYYTTTYDSGIVYCLLTTNERWIEYNTISYDYFSKYLKFTKIGDEKFIIENFDLTLDSNMKYLKLINQTKDQISVYFIPYNLIGKEKYLK